MCICVCVDTLLQVHLKNRELETRKLTAELQMQMVVDVNKENIITQFKEEVGRLRACLLEKEKLQKEILAKSAPTVRLPLRSPHFAPSSPFSLQQEWPA